MFKIRKHKGKFRIDYTDKTGYTRPVSHQDSREAAEQMAQELATILANAEHDWIRARAQRVRS